MKLVYIAGKYSDDTPIKIILNVLAAIVAGEQIANAGYAVFIPHLNHFWEKIFSHPYDFWMQQDEALLDKCDALVRLPGKSSGADAEVHRALTVLNIPVFYSVEEFLENEKAS